VTAAPEATAAAGRAVYQRTVGAYVRGRRARRARLGT
jgi:hypothetical protein